MTTHTRYSPRPSRWRQRLLVAVLGWGLCIAPVWPQRNSLPALGEDEGLSLSAERQIGDRIARELFRDPDYIEDAVLDEYVHTLWVPLVEAAAARGELAPELRERFAWRILLGKDRSINAFALPGGYLGVHLGLIAAVTTRDELASVLAHELSHVTQRHIARAMQTQERMTPLVIASLVLGALAASKNPQGAQAVMAGGQAAAAQSQLSYSRDMEREADRVGLGVLTDAGYDPSGFVTMFSKLQQASSLGDSGAYPYLRSHPLTTERIADMQSRLPLHNSGHAAGTTATTGQARSTVVHDAELALVAARARVLSQSQVDSLRTWVSLPQKTGAQANTAQQAGHLYAAALAHMLLREHDAAQQQWQRLQAVLATPTPENALAMRWVRLLGAELLAARGQPLQALNALRQATPTSGPWPRPEWLAQARLLRLLPASLVASEHAQLHAVAQQLRQRVREVPHDAAAWQALADMLHLQGRTLAALRAEGEAQYARMDFSGALDRFRAAQDAAQRAPLPSGEHIEASIIDSRVKAIEAQLHEQQKEK